MMLTVPGRCLIAGALLALTNVAWAARQFGEITVNKTDNVVTSFDVNFATATDTSTNTLIFAYGVKNGGDTTNAWEHVEIVSYVKPEEVTKHVVAPAGFGSEFFYARFFLSEGTAVPYDTRYESYTRNGNSYIDANYYPNQNTRVLADLTVNGQEYWFGCWATGPGTAAFAIRWESATSIYRGYNGMSNIKSGVNIQTGKRYLLDFNKNTVSLTCEDGTLGFPTNTCGAQSSFSTKPRSLYLFAFNEAGSRNSSGNATFHGCKIYDNGTLVRDYIPVSKGGTAYMFDVANAKLYPFLDGTPKAGAEVANDPYAQEVGPVNAASALVEFEDIRVFTVVRWNPAATGTGDGKSWANACTDWSTALTKAGVYKGEVWIKGGTYTVDKAMKLKNNVAILGGFVGLDGVYADDNAERAARDPKANPTVFTTTNKTQVDLDATGTVDATAVVDGIFFRNTTGGWLVYSDNAAATFGCPSFTNCTFFGGGVQLRKCAASFAGCRFENLRDGSYGRIFHENTGVKVVYTDCSFVSITNDLQHGLLNFASGASGSFKRCRFEDCVGQNGSGPATILPNAYVDPLDSCVFLNCQAAGGRIVQGLSMNDCRFEGCRSSAASLFNAAGRTVRTAFVGNVVRVDAPSVTSGTNYVDVVNPTAQATAFVNCTFENNVCEANCGAGATVVRSTVRWPSSSSMGGAVNCTFRNNAVDHDLTACNIVNNNKDYTSGYDVQIVNVVSSNTNAAFRTLRTYNCKTGGFCVYSSYLQGFAYDQDYAFLQLYDDIRTDDPKCETKFEDDGLHRTVRLYSNSSANRHRGRNVEVGANGAVRFKNKNGTYIYRFNSSSAPTEPIVMLDDMFGTERPEGKFVPGSSQLFQPLGFTLFVR